MKAQKFLLVILLLVAINSYSQNNFSYSPEKPNAGDLITITYTPSGVIAQSNSPLEAVAYNFSGEKGQKANELQLKKTKDGYVAIVKTDTANNLIYFKFSADGKIDDNKNNGYWIQLNKNGQLKKGADYDLSLFYQMFGRGVGLQPDNEKAMQYLDKEYAAHPETKQKTMVSYLSLYSQLHKDLAPALIQKEIEAAMKAGLKDEDDFDKVRTMYAMSKLTQQAKFIDSLKKEKFPKGKWTVGDYIQNYFKEKDLTAKTSMLDNIISKAGKDPEWKQIQPSLPYFKTLILNEYVAKKDWQGLDNAVRKYDIKGADLASLYNNTAWGMQEKDEDLEKAEELSGKAIVWAKNELKKPTQPKPDYMTAKDWEKSRKRTYGMYADSYAMINYKLGNYKKALPYAEDAAIKIAEGKDADENNTYALVAEKVLSPKKYIPQLEKFVRDGAAAQPVKDILKKEFLKNNNELAYEDYMAKLEKSSYLKMIEELKQQMISEKATPFMLVDLKGENVNLADWKNKVVVVDFWATWCGPCKASFPAMQKMVTKYKDDPEVKFLFIDTWEQGDKKEKAASDFITANKYDFHVLMDNDNKVVEQFKVSGIPTKFVIGKDGNINFKSVGFGGSNDQLVSELTAMIDMAKRK